VAVASRFDDQVKHHALVHWVHALHTCTHNTGHHFDPTR